MIDADGDGIPDVLEGAARTAIAEGMRIADAALARRREVLAEARREAAAAGREDQTRLSTLATISREKLRPVMGEAWWARSTPERAAEMYGEARAWDGVHPQESYFRAYAAEIERRAQEKHGMSPADLYRAAYATENAGDKRMDVEAAQGPEAGAQPRQEGGDLLSLEDANQVAAAAAPDWYRVVEKLDAETDPEARAVLENRLREDMTSLVDTGQLETDSAKEEWREYSGRDVSLEGAWKADRMDREKPGAVPQEVLEARSSGSAETVLGPATEAVPVVGAATARKAREEGAQVAEAVKDANQEKPREKVAGTGWDSAGRRERREEKLRGQGHTEEAIAGQRATDWSMRSRRGADPREPQKVDVSHIQRMRQAGQQKGPERGR